LPYIVGNLIVAYIPKQCLTQELAEEPAACKKGKKKKKNASDFLQHLAALETDVQPGSSAAVEDVATTSTSQKAQEQNAEPATEGAPANGRRELVFLQRIMSGGTLWQLELEDMFSLNIR